MDKIFTTIMNFTKGFIILIAGLFLTRKVSAVPTTTTTTNNNTVDVDPVLSVTIPTSTFQVRNDTAGGGNFGDPRGNRLHEGVDLVVSPGEAILASIDGYVVRTIQVYADTTEYVGVEIQGTGDYEDYNVEMFYVQLFSHLSAGVNVGHNQAIGFAQDISNRVEGSIPHLHYELKYKGVKIDPLNLLIV